mmetsp:Transcript_12003/g.48353  ORF Transcript_12003/g.48353 Transcript_12003/m.48353 type:complete len:291 (-) Transcript_12003:40-912(-)
MLLSLDLAGAEGADAFVATALRSMLIICSSLGAVGVASSWRRSSAKERRSGRSSCAWWGAGGAASERKVGGDGCSEGEVGEERGKWERGEERAEGEGTGGREGCAGHTLTAVAGNLPVIPSKRPSHHCCPCVSTSTTFPGWRPSSPGCFAANAATATAVHATLAPAAAGRDGRTTGGGAGSSRTKLDGNSPRAPLLSPNHQPLGFLVRIVTLLPAARSSSDAFCLAYAYTATARDTPCAWAASACALLCLSSVASASLLLASSSSLFLASASSRCCCCRRWRRRISSGET